MNLTKTAFVSLAVLSLASAQAMAAAQSRTFADVTSDVFQCVKETSASRQGTIYASTDGLNGTATTSSTLWIVVMEYAFSAETESLRYTMIRKSWVVPAQSVWSGIDEMITECRGA